MCEGEERGTLYRSRYNSFLIKLTRVSLMQRYIYAYNNIPNILNRKLKFQLTAPECGMVSSRDEHIECSGRCGMPRKRGNRELLEVQQLDEGRIQFGVS